MTARRLLSALLAFGLVTAACGGDGGDAASTTAAGAASTTGATAGPQTVVSPDGRLGLKVPAGAPQVTVAEITAAEAGVDDVALVLGTYDLGPDGATFETPVVATFDTGMTVDPAEPLPLLVVAVENDDGEYEALSTRVDVTAGTMTLTAQVPHFSRLVIVGSPDGLSIWPDEIVAPVGAVWWGSWGIYDRRTRPLMNAAARIQWRDGYWDEDTGLVKVQPLIDGIDIDPYATASGVVDILEDSSVGSYVHYPDEAVGRDDTGLFPEFVEIFWGEALFTCDAAGLGTYGFDVEVYLPAGSVAFSTRLADGRRVVVVPAGGATITYVNEADALCIDTRYGSTVNLLSRYLGVPQGVVGAFLDSVLEDGMHDGIWSIPGVLPGLYQPNVDLWDSVMARVRITQPRLDVNLNYSVFECGATVSLPDLDALPVTTVCADEVQPIPGGDVVVVMETLSGPLAVDGDGAEYVYAAVFESNGDPSDDWQYQGDYEWDFFRDTDRWYQVLIHADGTRELLVTEPLGPPLPSGARALLFEDTVLWLIPAGEFDGDTLSGRVSAFVHDGTYDPATGQGDVSGADPTEPLVEVVSLDG
ncbi:MAG: hypothetical protein KQH83_12125 [Actinobacteria bacterium]|nr:hypothetical protein [Actinomycetota bacterium]